MSSSINFNLFTIILLLICSTPVVFKATNGAPTRSELLFDRLAIQEADHHNQLLDDASQADNGTKVPTVLKTKFLILTTGEHIKLYPVTSKDGTVDSFDNENFLLVRPSDFNASDWKTFERLGHNSTFTKWLRHKHASQLNQTRMDPNHQFVANIRQSILPQNRVGKNTAHHDELDEHLYKSQHQNGFKWQRPFITKVDHFLDTRYCNDAQNDPCLVLVWLDQANKFVRFGSVNLNGKLEHLMNHKKGKTSRDTTTAPRRSENATLWLDEFPPIDLCKEALDVNQSDVCEVHDLVIQKDTQTIAVIMSAMGRPVDGRSHLWFVLTLGLTPNLHHFEQFKAKQKFLFNDDCNVEFAPQIMSPSFISSTRMIYLEKGLGSKVITLDLSANNPGVELKSAKQRQVFDVRSKLPIQKMSLVFYEQRIGQRWPSAIAMAVDQSNLLLYLLMEDNRLYSTNFLGDNARYVGQLSVKPAIRAPNEMHYVDGSLLLSDSSRRSLMAYKLPSISRQQEDTATNRLKPTHKVLLVEMPTIQDFSIVNLDLTDELESLPCDDEIMHEHIETTFEYQQVEARMRDMVLTPGLASSHCETQIFIGRDDGKTAGIPLSSTWMIIWVIIVWLSYLLAKMILGDNGKRLMKLASTKIKLMRPSHHQDGLTTVLTTKLGQVDSEKGHP